MDTTNKDSNFYTPQEFADIVGVHRLTVYRWIETNKIDSIKIGQRVIRIPKRELEKHMNNMNNK